jgi:hypothetical protein
MIVRRARVLYRTKLFHYLRTFAGHYFQRFLRRFRGLFHETFGHRASGLRRVAARGGFDGFDGFAVFAVFSGFVRRPTQ